MSELDIRAIRSRHGPTYKLEVSGVVNRIAVTGYTRQVSIGIDEITPSLVAQKLVLNRTDGTGKEVPYGARQKVEKAVLKELRGLEKAANPLSSLRNVPQCLVRVNATNWAGAATYDLWLVVEGGQIVHTIKDHADSADKIMALGYDPNNFVDLEVSKKEFKRLAKGARQPNTALGPLVDLSSADTLRVSLRDLGVSNKVAAQISQAYPGGRGLEDAPDSALRDLGATVPQAKRVKAAFAVVRVCDHACERRVWGMPLRQPSDVVGMFRAKIGHKEQEFFAVALLDAHQKVTDILGVAVGSLAQVEVHPREVFREAIRRNAHAMIVAHNHPSGNARPSDADFALTQRLVSVGSEIGIPVLDSFVITRKSYTSMAEQQVLPTAEAAMAAERNVEDEIVLTGRGLELRRPNPQVRTLARRMANP